MVSTYVSDQVGALCSPADLLVMNLVWQTGMGPEVLSMVDGAQAMRAGMSRSSQHWPSRKGTPGADGSQPRPGTELGWLSSGREGTIGDAAMAAPVAHAG